MSNTFIFPMLLLAVLIHIVRGSSMEDINSLDDEKRYALNEIIDSLHSASRANGGFSTDPFTFDSSEEEDLQRIFDPLGEVVDGSDEDQSNLEGSGEDGSNFESSGEDQSGDTDADDFATLPMAQALSRPRRAKGYDNFYFLPSRG